MKELKINQSWLQQTGGKKKDTTSILLCVSLINDFWFSPLFIYLFNFIKSGLRIYINPAVVIKAGINNKSVG